MYLLLYIFFFKQKTAYDMRISDWSSDVCSSDLIILGLGLYGIGALLWLFVLGRAPLSLAYPFVGIGFILTMLAGAFWLNESISVARAAGTLLIAVGCVLVARSA